MPPKKKLKSFSHCFLCTYSFKLSVPIFFTVYECVTKISEDLNPRKVEDSWEHVQKPSVEWVSRRDGGARVSGVPRVVRVREVRQGGHSKSATLHVFQGLCARREVFGDAVCVFIFLLFFLHV